MEKDKYLKLKEKWRRYLDEEQGHVNRASSPEDSDEVCPVPSQNKSYPSGSGPNPQIEHADVGISKVDATVPHTLEQQLHSLRNATTFKGLPSPTTSKVMKNKDISKTKLMLAKFNDEVDINKQLRSLKMNQPSEAMTYINLGPQGQFCKKPFKPLYAQQHKIRLETILEEDEGTELEKQTHVEVKQQDLIENPQADLASNKDEPNLEQESELKVPQTKDWKEAKSVVEVFPNIKTNVTPMSVDVEFDQMRPEPDSPQPIILPEEERM